MNYRQVCRKLIKLGCYELPRRSGGPHRKWANSNNGWTSSIPDHGSADLKTGTIRAIVRYLGISWDDFKDA